MTSARYPGPAGADPGLCCATAFGVVPDDVIVGVAAQAIDSTTRFGVDRDDGIEAPTGNAISLACQVPLATARSVAPKSSPRDPAEGKCRRPRRRGMYEVNRGSVAESGGSASLAQGQLRLALGKPATRSGPEGAPLGGAAIFASAGIPRGVHQRGLQ